MCLLDDGLIVVQTARVHIPVQITNTTDSYRSCTLVLGLPTGLAPTHSGTLVPYM